MYIYYLQPVRARSLYSPSLVRSHSLAAQCLLSHSCCVPHTHTHSPAPPNQLSSSLRLTFSPTLLYNKQDKTNDSFDSN